jgi:hypothetical protein
MDNFVARQNEVVGVQKKSQTNYDDSETYRCLPRVKKPVPVPEPTYEPTYNSDDEEVVLKRFEHNDSEYLRDEETHAVYHYETRIKLGIYNEGANEVDLFEPNEC